MIKRQENPEGRWIRNNPNQLAIEWKRDEIQPVLLNFCNTTTLCPINDVPGTDKNQIHSNQTDARPMGNVCDKIDPDQTIDGEVSGNSSNVDTNCKCECTCQCDTTDAINQTDCNRNDEKRVNPKDNETGKTSKEIGTETEPCGKEDTKEIGVDDMLCNEDVSRQKIQIDDVKNEPLDDSKCSSVVDTNEEKQVPETIQHELTQNKDESECSTKKETAERNERNEIGNSKNTIPEKIQNESIHDKSRNELDTVTGITTPEGSKNETLQDKRGKEFENNKDETVLEESKTETTQDIGRNELPPPNDIGEIPAIDKPDAQPSTSHHCECTASIYCTSRYCCGGRCCYCCCRPRCCSHCYCQNAFKPKYTSSPLRSPSRGGDDDGLSPSKRRKLEDDPCRGQCDLDRTSRCQCNLPNNTNAGPSNVHDASTRVYDDKADTRCRGYDGGSVRQDGTCRSDRQCGEYDTRVTRSTQTGMDENPNDKGTQTNQTQDQGTSTDDTYAMSCPRGYQGVTGGLSCVENNNANIPPSVMNDCSEMLHTRDNSELLQPYERRESKCGTHERFYHNAYLNYFVRLFRLEKFQGRSAPEVAKYAGKHWRTRMSEEEKKPYYDMRQHAPPRKKR